MKILYAATDQKLDSYHGGTIHVLSVARELSRQGHRVLVLYQQPEGGAATVQLPEEIEYRTIPPRHRFLLWSAGNAIDETLENFEPDVVMERYYNFAGEVVLRAAAYGIPAVLEVNSPMMEYRGSLKSIVDLLLLNTLKRRRKKIAQAASLIIAPIPEIVPPAFREKVREMEWGADTDLFDPALLPDKEILRLEKGFDPEAILLVHFGSLRAWHGFDLLMDAFRLLEDLSKAPIQLVVIGPSPGVKPEKNVHFAGSVPHEDLPAWLKMSDIAVLPFTPERHPYLQLGFYWSPLKIFEAMSMEMPVITLDHPRLHSILGTDSPGFFYNGTPGGLADRILEMVEDLPVYQATAKAFRERMIRKYSWQAHAARLGNWLTDLAVNSAGPAGMKP